MKVFLACLATLLVVSASPAWGPPVFVYQRPIDAMVDITNDLVYLACLTTLLVVSASPAWGPPVFVYQRPIDAMVDITNDLGVAVLQDHVSTRSNFAFSPYGVASVLVLLYEGARGESARQIHNALRFPWERDVTRVGFRDIHRHLRTYFSHEGYLSGITLSKNQTSLLPEYQRVLRFYGYDVSKGPGARPQAVADVPANSTAAPAESASPLAEQKPTAGDDADVPVNSTAAPADMMLNASDIDVTDGQNVTVTSSMDTTIASSTTSMTTTPEETTVVVTFPTTTSAEKITETLTTRSSVEEDATIAQASSTENQDGVVTGTTEEVPKTTTKQPSVYRPSTEPELTSEAEVQMTTDRIPQESSTVPLVMTSPEEQTASSLPMTTESIQEAFTSATRIPTSTEDADEEAVEVTFAPNKEEISTGDEASDLTTMFPSTVSSNTDPGTTVPSTVSSNTEPGTTVPSTVSSNTEPGTTVPSTVSSNTDPGTTVPSTVSSNTEPGTTLPSTVSPDAVELITRIPDAAPPLLPMRMPTTTPSGVKAEDFLPMRRPANRATTRSPATTMAAEERQDWSPMSGVETIIGMVNSLMKPGQDAQNDESDESDDDGAQEDDVQDDSSSRDAESPSVTSEETSSSDENTSASVEATSREEDNRSTTSSEEASSEEASSSAEERVEESGTMTMITEMAEIGGEDVEVTSTTRTSEGVTFNEPPTTLRTDVGDVTTSRTKEEEVTYKILQEEVTTVKTIDDEFMTTLKKLDIEVTTTKTLDDDVTTMTTQRDEMTTFRTRGEETATNMNILDDSVTKLKTNNPDMTTLNAQDDVMTTTMPLTVEKQTTVEDEVTTRTSDDVEKTTMMSSVEKQMTVEDDVTTRTSDDVEKTTMMSSVEKQTTVEDDVTTRTSDDVEKTTMMSSVEKQMTVEDGVTTRTSDDVEKTTMTSPVEKQTTVEDEVTTRTSDDVEKTTMTSDDEAVTSSSPVEQVTDAVVTETDADVADVVTEVPDATRPTLAAVTVKTLVEATNQSEASRTRRALSDPGSLDYPDISLQLQNGMYGSHVSRGDALYTQLPRYPFLVDGVSEELVPVMSYTSVFPYAYVPRIHALALEFPLDDERYKLLLLLPVERRGLRQLIFDLSSCPLREIYRTLKPTRVRAVIPSFMVEGFVILTSTLQQLGIWDVFDPRRSNLSGMSNDPELYVRNIEQSITVVIRNYVEIVDIQTRTMAARGAPERFQATHPFLYFVMDTETQVALMAGKIVDPLNSRIY